jgi:hypothetical protein
MFGRGYLPSRPPFLPRTLRTILHRRSIMGISLDQTGLLQCALEVPNCRNSHSLMSGQSCARIPPIQRGYKSILEIRLIRGTAFSKEERRTFKLAGLLPSRINDLELQAQRYNAERPSLLIVARMDNMRVTLPTFSRTPFSNL